MFILLIIMEELFRFSEWPVLISLIRKKRKKAIRRMKRNKRKKKIIQKI